jgi:LPXTG-site transpeptidase (sortase) family protein
MVIAAHVDSTIQGLGPFASLLSAHRGDRLTVKAAHLTQRFSVSQIALVTKTNRSAVAAQFSGLGRDRLVLITCAGPFIPAKGGYQNIAVITARPVALSPAR